jgi:hypothetical protein
LPQRTSRQLETPLPGSLPLSVSRHHHCPRPMTPPIEFQYCVSVARLSFRDRLCKALSSRMHQAMSPYACCLCCFRPVHRPPGPAAFSMSPLKQLPPPLAAAQISLSDAQISLSDAFPELHLPSGGAGRSPCASAIESALSSTGWPTAIDHGPVVGARAARPIGTPARRHCAQMEVRREPGNGNPERLRAREQTQEQLRTRAM